MHILIGAGDNKKGKEEEEEEWVSIAKSSPLMAPDFQPSRTIIRPEHMCSVFGEDHPWAKVDVILAREGT